MEGVRMEGEDGGSENGGKRMDGVRMEGEDGWSENGGRG